MKEFVISEAKVETAVLVGLITQTLFGKCPVSALEHIPAELRTRLLQGRDGRSCRHAACGAALGHVAVSADFLQLLDAAVAVAQAVALQTRRLQRPEAVVVQAPHHMKDVPRQVSQLFLIDSRRVAQHLSLIHIWLSSPMFPLTSSKLTPSSMPPACCQFSSRSASAAQRCV